MAPRVWTCQRVRAGVKCAHVNPKRRQICAACGKRRPKTKRPEHMAALDTMDYAACVEAFGERCGICGATPKPGKKLRRDHEHRGAGIIRGLLCVPCNRTLNSRIDNVEWLSAAISYLRVAEEMKLRRVT